MTKAQQNEFVLIRSLELVSELTAKATSYRIKSVLEMLSCICDAEQIAEEAQAIAKKELEELLEGGN